MDKKERDAVERDRILFGTGIAVDGKRVDPATVTMMTHGKSVVVPVDDLAQEIRRVDGNHSLGAGALAEALLPFLSERLAAAPAPSSLAGGGDDFAHDLARTLDRYGLKDAGWSDADIADALEMVGEPSGVSQATVKAIMPMIEARLAALSPEAPAREGDVSAEEHRARGVRLIGMTEWAGAHLCRAEKAEAKLASLSGGADVEAQIAEAWDSLLNADDRTSPDEYPEHLLITRGELAGFMGDAAFIARVSEPATLTPRHEAPASHSFEASHSVHREGGCKVCGHDEASHEAPAEGAGEREALAAIMHRNMIPDEDGGFSFYDLKAADQIMDYLRARSSAPEDREWEAPVRGEIRVINGKRCRFIERELEGDKWEIIGPAHPAAPSADKLRIAVEALETSRENLIGWFEAIDAEIRVEHEMHVSLKDDLAVIDQALATLEAE